MKEIIDDFMNQIKSKSQPITEYEKMIKLNNFKNLKTNVYLNAS